MGSIKLGDGGCSYPVAAVAAVVDTDGVVVGVCKCGGCGDGRGGGSGLHFVGRAAKFGRGEGFV